MKRTGSGSFLRLAPALCFAAILSVPLARSSRAVLVVSGEDSLGTWLSQSMLVACGAFSLQLCAIRRTWPWRVWSPAFVALALDERFMFHETIKERIQLLLPTTPPRLAEAPVVVVALAGAIAARFLWRDLRTSGRALLSLGVVLGTASVGMDVARAGTLPEDVCKLLAELCVTQALWGELVPAPVRA
ncbi:MAG TPA: hypothetical protein PKO15_00275 [Fibrobacteria bacterium]|nr:hypothetical protein [Fibrobacteria bacterium]HOX50436.1 hypothetical protein [Fibrobacteria bacterium]